MPLSYHSDRREKFKQQYDNAQEYIIPFIENVVSVRDARVLEIGCGEGGILKAFLKSDSTTVVGVDLNTEKIDFANEMFHDEIQTGVAKFIAIDIYDDGFLKHFRNAFDIVVLKDTIEHIFDHERILLRIKKLLSGEGILFVAFPPWYMPYGGHQQMAKHIGKLPYYHLLPRNIYQKLLKLFGESTRQIDSLLEIYDTRITIRQFDKYLDVCGYQTLQREFFLINPIYKAKFGLTPRRQLPLIRRIPLVRDFITTTCYYIVQPDSSNN